MAKVVYTSTESGPIGKTLLPRKKDIVMYQGDPFNINLGFGSSPTTRINLTGCLVECEIKKTTNSTPISARMTVSEDGLKVNMYLSSSDTESMSGKYDYDLQVTRPGQQPRTYMYGQVEVISETTRSS
jgi:hypothetical protein